MDFPLNFCAIRPASSRNACMSGYLSGNGQRTTCVVSWARYRVSGWGRSPSYPIRKNGRKKIRKNVTHLLQKYIDKPYQCDIL